MKDLNILVGGSAGEGIQTIGAILAQTALLQGYAAFSWQEYESRIRGGQNSFSVRISEKIYNAPAQSADIVLALNEQAAKKYMPLLKDDGVLIAPKDINDHTLVVPFTDIAKDRIGKKIFANTVAMGALAAALGLDLDALIRVLEERFEDKGENVTEANSDAARAGYETGKKECKDQCPWELPKSDKSYFHLTSHQAIPIAATYSGCRFMSAYPMTPSTDIITYLAKEPRCQVFTEQAEDEIAAINMALGASFAGVRAMTATAGGGFALMVESISLSGMTETPLVVVVGQRPGPATGLPTRTSQADLLFVINAGHGEFPKMVLAPSDPVDAFHKTVKAFNLADKYQIPVVILTDQFLADSEFSFEKFPFREPKPEFYLADPEKIEHYKRYQITDKGVSPRLYPGQSEHLVAADSDEHDELGHITENLDEVAVPMAQKRMAKLEGLRSEIEPPEEQGLEDCDRVLVGWGSSKNAILECIELLKKDGIEAGMIHFTELWPLPEYEFDPDRKYYGVETNATGQLARLLRSEYGITFEGQVTRIDGLPLTGGYIRSRLNEQ